MQTFASVHASLHDLFRTEHLVWIRDHIALCGEEAGVGQVDV